jgi:hypothetical protein
VVSSWEFTEWIAFWQYEAELSQPPDPAAKPSLPELTQKIYAFKDRQNARWAAQQAREQALGK